MVIYILYISHSFYIPARVRDNPRLLPASVKIPLLYKIPIKKMSLSTMRHITDRSTREFRSALYVTRSPIRKAGNGLFSQRRIYQGDVICEYFGRYITQQDLDNGLEDKHYCVGDGEGVIISALNAQGEIECAAGYINDIMEDYLTNCQFQWVGQHCYVVAVTDIDDGEELLYRA